MHGLYLRGFDIDHAAAEVCGGWLSRVPAVRYTDGMDFTAPVTFFTGENGTGKSTLLEALAVALGLNPEGGTNNYRFHTYDDYSALGGAVVLHRGAFRPKRSYFLRAESFYNMATAANTDYAESFSGRLPDYHARSHGESFLDFIRDNAGAELCLLDEPEAALSPQRQLSLLLMLHRQAEAGTQFIIATHSPILLGLPDADILEFGAEGIRRTVWAETESCRVTRMFLEDRERVLHRLMEE